MVAKFRAIPSVSEALADPEVAALVGAYSHDSIVAVVREELDAARDTVRAGGGPPTLPQVVVAVARRAEAKWRAWPRGVVNATGVVLHTNLGRAPLSRASLDAARVAALGYSDLEFDLETGSRGSRQAHISRLIRQATGAAAAFVVNNNASAVMLGLAAVAAGKQVIVSRGEAVEIGGGFRIPDVLRQSGAELVEVGTTNRTYAADFANAINENTGAILSVHASNFRVVGFTHAPTTAELVEVGARSGVPVLHDLGSGCLLDTRPYGLAHEPMPQDSVAAGVALSFFSGDKLMGGPQAGVIVGKREWVDVVSRHPLARAVRIDKMNMAALSATALHYIRGEALSEVPVWKMISAPLDGLERRASAWASDAGSPGAGLVSVVPARSAIGGGSLPGETMRSVALRIDCERLGASPESVLAALRGRETPIIARIEDGGAMLDPRTVMPEHDEAVANALADIL